MPDPTVHPIAISALQHYLFCPRQCALIHVEQVWAENALTAEGRIMHEATAAAGHEVRRGVRVATAMPLASVALGVSGIADLVELHPTGEGGWQPYPVEYKRGKPKAHRADEVQLCAQAICLEEMFDTTIEEGAGGGVMPISIICRAAVAISWVSARNSESMATAVRRRLTP